MTEPTPSAFSAWSARWLQLAGHPDENATDQLIAHLLELWENDIPGPWERGADPQLLDPAIRYRRGDLHSPHPGEHALEHDVLEPDPKSVTTTCFGLRLQDGINAIPLVRDNAGGRTGNVEADMLLLTGEERESQLLLVEAKTSSNTVLYATVESLRQLRLFLASPAAAQIMPTRQSHHAPSATSVAAVVLAPADYYSPTARTGRSTETARRLIGAVQSRFDVDLRLATWNPVERVIAEVEQH